MPRSAGPSSAGVAIGAGVKLLQKAMIALNGWAVAHRTNAEIKNLETKIRQLMPKGGGVMLCVGIQEWEMPDPTGARAQSFLSLHIVDAGTSPATILKKYLHQARLTQGAAKGWKRKDVYLWVTEI